VLVVDADEVVVGREGTGSQQVATGDTDGLRDPIVDGGGGVETTAWPVADGRPRLWPPREAVTRAMAMPVNGITTARAVAAPSALTPGRTDNRFLLTDNRADPT
jgi:hypothetical protein